MELDAVPTMLAGAVRVVLRGRVKPGFYNSRD